MNGYLSIRNWDRFQHYKDRRPPWIKFHVDWLDDYDLSALPTPTRLLAAQLLLVAAKQDNRIPNDPLWVAKRVTMSPQQTAKGLKELQQIRFVEPIKRKRRASKPLAERYPSRARPEADKPEVEVKETKPDGLLDLNEFGRQIEARANGSRSQYTLLVDVLTDWKPDSERILRPLIEKLAPYRVEHIREEVLANHPRKPTAYAVALAQKAVEQQEAAA